MNCIYIISVYYFICFHNYLYNLYFAVQNKTYTNISKLIYLAGLALEWNVNYNQAY